MPRTTVREFALIDPSTNALGEVPTFDPDYADDLYSMQEEAEQSLVRNRYAHSRRPLGRLEFSEYADE